MRHHSIFIFSFVLGPGGSLCRKYITERYYQMRDDIGIRCVTTEQEVKKDRDKGSLFSKWKTIHLIYRKKDNRGQDKSL